MAFIANPSVPFSYHIAPLSQDRIIQIAGRTLPHPKSFSINFQCEPKSISKDDVALHICMRFDGKLSKVVRNSMQNQQWSIEESYGPFPLNVGGNQSFEILILCLDEGFKIAVNGKHHSDFGHRLPISRIENLNVDGDLNLICVRLEKHSLTADGEVSNDKTLKTEDALSSHKLYHQELQQKTTEKNGSNIRCNEMIMPCPGNKSPTVLTKHDDPVSTTTEIRNVLSGAVTGYGSAKLVYPGYTASRPKQMDHKTTLILGSKEKSSRHKPTKASCCQYTSSSSSGSSSCSEE